MNVNFFTPIKFTGRAESALNFETTLTHTYKDTVHCSALTFVDDYFPSWFSGQIAVVDTKKTEEYEITTEKNSAWKFTCRKVIQFISYFTIVCPIAFLIAKCILRHQLKERMALNEIEKSVQTWAAENSSRRSAARSITEAARMHSTYLNLFRDQLTSLPPAIGQLRNLKRLDLSDNQFTALPPQIGQLRNLKRLDLSGNRLTSLPTEIGQLRNLEELGLSHNQLASLPTEIGQLRNLKSLNLSYNQLTALSSEIGQLTALYHLGLSDNQLTSLPPAIGQLRKLNVLFLTNNALTQLPRFLLELSSNCTINANNNRFSPEEMARIQAELNDIRQQNPKRGPALYLSSIPRVSSPPPALPPLILWTDYFSSLPPSQETPEQFQEVLKKIEEAGRTDTPWTIFGILEQSDRTRASLEKGFRSLLSQVHPDKNLDHKELATTLTASLKNLKDFLILQI